MDWHASDRARVKIRHVPIVYQQPMTLKRNPSSTSSKKSLFRRSTTSAAINFNTKRLGKKNSSLRPRKDSMNSSANLSANLSPNEVGSPAEIEEDFSRDDSDSNRGSARR